MGNLKAVFDSVLYAIAILIVLALAGMVFGINYMFDYLFSFPGMIVLFFLVFTTIAK